jgi:hemerythrin-like domain-containing protein
MLKAMVQTKESETLPDFDEPLEMLSACHESIETQLSALERLVEHLAKHGCDFEARSAAQGLLRYFDTSGALHHQDEDQDLFPLLRVSAARLGHPEVAAAIDELEREHATMDRQWKRLRKELGAVATGEGRLDVEDVVRFAWLYRRHIDRESAAVLPFAKQTLAANQLRALGERMAARRNLLTT